MARRIVSERFRQAFAPGGECEQLGEAAGLPRERADMAIRNLTAEPAAVHQAISAICADAGIDLKDCYQCGKCAAGCPVAESADMSCRTVIRNLQLGLLDPVLASNMPWLCVGCATCVARCPQSVDMPSLNEALCRYAMAHGKVAVPEGDKFMNIFLDNVENKGVSDETLLAMRYNFSTGHLFQDVANSPKMLSRGLLSGDGYRPSDASEVGQMVKRLRTEPKDAPAEGGRA